MSMEALNISLVLPDAGVPLGLESQNFEPKFPIFRPLQVYDKAKIIEVTQKFQPLAAINFLSLLSWGQTQISYLNSNLVLATLDVIENKIIYTLLGIKNIKKSVAEIFALQQAQGIVPALHLIPEEILLNAVDLHRHFSIQLDRGNCSYVYAIKPFLEHFSSMRTHRNLFNRFKANYAIMDFPLHNLSDDLVFNNVLQIFTQWQVEKNRTNEEVRLELEALMKMRDQAIHFNLYVLFLIVENNIIGFHIIEFSSQKHLIRHIGKVLAGYLGADEMMYYKEAQMCLAIGYEYINTGEDHNIAGLRSHKESYHPTFLVKSYSIFSNN